MREIFYNFRKMTEKPVFDDNSHELLAMPEFLAKMTDQELYDTILASSNAFKRSISSFCLLNGIGERDKEKIELSKAKEAGLIRYKNLWIEPLVIFPKRFQKVIDNKELIIAKRVDKNILKSFDEEDKKENESRG